MNFTEDWFTHNIPNFEKCMSALSKRELFMEIGSYEGRSTCWLLQNGLAEDGEFTCIDPFNGSVEHGGIDFDAVKERFLSNTQEARRGTQFVDLHEATSYTVLSWLILDTVGETEVYDFIYVDGSHAPDVALTDACMAWGLLRSGGVMLFDDYQYPHESTKVGIDAFLAGFAGQYEVILNNYQLAVKKK